MVNYFTCLGISETASEQEIKSAYRRMALKYHPDVTTLPKEQAEQKMILLNEAYRVLSDPQTRACYIRELHAAQPQAPAHSAKPPPSTPYSAPEPGLADKVAQAFGTLLGILIPLFLLGALIASILYYVPDTIRDTWLSIQEEWQAILRSFR